MKKIFLGIALGVSGSLIFYGLWVGEDIKIPSSVGCKIVDCYEEQSK